MCWLKRDMWQAGIAIAGMLLLLVLMVWVPVSAVDAHEGTSGLAITEPVQATPTVDLTVTALAKEQLALQVKQLQNQLQDQNNWFANNSTALIAAVATVIVALFGIFQWALTVRQSQNKELRDRADERQKEVAAQNKELRAQAEERLKTAVAALGDENEATQVGGAILLRSFLHKEDEKIYGRYYTQIFDLAVAYLCLSSTSQPSENPNTPLPLTPLRQALIVVFKEAFPLARSQIQGSLEALDATGILLDNAYLTRADLKQARMRRASLLNVNCYRATLSGARLFKSNLSGADLGEADLSGADLGEANIEEALSLKDANLRGVTGLTREQLEACKAKGAIIDEAPTTSPLQSPVSPPPPEPRNGT